MSRCCSFFVLLSVFFGFTETWDPVSYFRHFYQWNDTSDVSGLNSIPTTYQGMDSYQENYDDVKKVGNEFMDQHFYLCYQKDGTKSYYRKLDQRHFINKRYWVVSSETGFIASMEFC